MTAFDYEAQRQANIEANNKILAELGLDVDVFMGGPTVNNLSQTSSTTSKSKSKKRGADDMDDYDGVEEDQLDDDEDDDEEKEKKRAKKAKKASKPKPVQSRPSLGTRTSARQRGKAVVDYTDEGMQAKNKRDSVPKLVSKAARRARSPDSDVEMGSGDDDDEESRPRHKLGKRTKNPKTFGHIPGVPVGKVWELRMHCSTDAVHAPPVAGISGNKDVGAWSVALSGGYEDDIDLGYSFTFTGAGGRDLKGTKDKPKNLRTGPQTKDQDFDFGLNAALKKSSETKKPVRVIRGYKLDSKYAPAEGYRYDGLYTVEKAWMERGLNPGGWKVCKFALKRMPGQPPIPERDLEAEKKSAKKRHDTTEPEDEGTTDQEGETTDGVDRESSKDEEDDKEETPEKETPKEADKAPEADATMEDAEPKADAEPEAAATPEEPPKAAETEKTEEPQVQADDKAEEKDKEAPAEA